MPRADTFGPVPRVEERAVLTVVEAGHYLGLGRSAAYECAARGELPTIRVGRRLLVPTAAFRRLLLLVDADEVGA